MVLSKPLFVERVTHSQQNKSGLLDYQSHHYPYFANTSLTSIVCVGLCDKRYVTKREKKKKKKKKKERERERKSGKLSTPTHTTCYYTVIQWIRRYCALDITQPNEQPPQIQQKKLPMPCKCHPYSREWQSWTKNDTFLIKFLTTVQSPDLHAPYSFTESKWSWSFPMESEHSWSISP